MQEKGESFLDLWTAFFQDCSPWTNDVDCDCDCDCSAETIKRLLSLLFRQLVNRISIFATYYGKHLEYAALTTAAFRSLLPFYPAEMPLTPSGIN